MAVYEITERTANKLTVKGNLDGAGVAGQNGQVGKGAHWFVVAKNPQLGAGPGGTGKTEGKYEINSAGNDSLNNKYAGAYLILGDFDFAMLGWVSKPADLKVYRIARSSDKHVWIDDAGADLSSAPHEWMIVMPRTELKRPFEWVVLNAAYKSCQKLAWFSGDLSQMRNKRLVYKQNGEFRWLTERGNYRLVKLPNSGEEDKFTVSWNPGVIERQCDQEGLTLWAANQISGANTYEITYEVALGLLDLSVRVGDRLIDSQIDSGATVSAIRYDLDNQTMNITANSWS